MYNTHKQSLEQKRKQEKMNMILNNLEQKLGGNQELCQGIAKVIDMTVETNQLVERLEEIETNIPAIEQRILGLIQECILSCDEARKDICARIYDMFVEINQQNAPAKMIKIHKTIDCCIANYSTYKQSQYNAKYTIGRDAAKNASSMSVEDLLDL